MCRQDVGKSICRNKRQQQQQSQPPPQRALVVVDPQREPQGSTTSDLLRQSYDSFHENGSDRPTEGSNDDNRIIRVNTLLGGTILFRHPSSRVTENEGPLQTTEANEGMPLLASSRNRESHRID